MRLLISLPFAAFLAACLPEDPPDLPDDSVVEDPVACEADQWQGLIGQPAQAATAIPEPKRIIKPGQAVTMDHRPDRTNVDLDDTGLITRIWCG